MAEDQNQNNPAPQSENEISDYYEGMKKLELEGYETGIKKARTALFVTAALVFVGEMIAASVAGIGFTPLLIGIAVVEAGIFVALGFWTKTKPYAAIVTGLILFILMWVAAIAINGGKAAYSGVIVRIIIIVYLFSAIKPAKAWEETKKSG
ncbi:MAG: hypothetical protein ABIR30_06280 [Chitinophagaceae bacterium]